jgi:hypothetical protein
MDMDEWMVCSLLHSVDWMKYCKTNIFDLDPIEVHVQRCFRK